VVPVKRQTPDRSPPSVSLPLCTSDSYLVKGWGEINSSSLSCDYFASAERQVVDLLHLPLKGSHSFSIHIVQMVKKGEKCYTEAYLRANVNLHSSSLELAVALMRMPKELPGKTTHMVSYRVLSPDL